MSKQTAEVPFRMRLDEMQRVWLNVANGVGSHGDFLKTFGLAYTRADADNQVKMYSASIALIEKYNLNTGEYTRERGA